MKKACILLLLLLFAVKSFSTGISDIISVNTAGVTISDITSNTTYPWSWNKDTGFKSSNVGVDNSTSTSTLSITIDLECKFTFAYTVSSEKSYDKFSVLIDGVTVLQDVSGTVTDTFVKQLSEGTHSMTVTYVKDGSTQSGTDLVCITDMQFVSTAIQYNTTSELTGETGITEIYCSDPAQLAKLIKYAKGDDRWYGYLNVKKLKISGYVSMFSFETIADVDQSGIEYLDLSEATIVAGQPWYHAMYGGGWSGEGIEGEFDTGVFIHNGGQDSDDYSDLHTLVLPDHLTNFKCRHNANSDYYRYYLLDIYSRSSTPVEGIDSYTYEDGVLHVPSGSKSAWSEAVNRKQIVVADTPEKIITTSGGGNLSSYLTNTDRINLDILTVKGRLDAQDFKYIASMTELSKLDISGAVIDSYNGLQGPNSSVLDYPTDEIPAYSFKDNQSLKRIITSAHSVGAHAFQNATGLYKFEFSETSNAALKVMEYAFDGCSITSLSYYSDWGYVNRGFYYLGDFSFRNTTLQSLYLDDTSDCYIGKNPFLSDIVKSEYDFGRGGRYHHYRYDDNYDYYDVHGISFEETKTANSSNDYDTSNQLLYSSEKTKLIASCLYDQQTVIINDVTNTINDYALSQLLKVTDITLGRNVQTIGEAFMYGCPRLASITVAPGNTYYMVSDKVLYSADGKNVIRFPSAGGTECLLISSVTNIRSMAFEGSKLKSLTVLASEPPVLSSDAFINADVSNLTVYVDVASLSKYQADEKWNVFDIQAKVDDRAILVSELTLNETSLTLEEGEEFQLIATILPQNATDNSVEWKSEDMSVLTVNESGLVTAFSAGSTTVTATTCDGSGISVSCDITVMEKSSTVEEDTDISLFENVIYVDKTEGASGSKVRLSLMMNNVIAPTGFQCDLCLPEGFDVAEDEDGFLKIDLSTSRTTSKKHDMFSSARQQDGTVKIMCSSTNSYTFSSNKGEIASITISIDDDVKDGEYPIIIRNMVISDVNAVAYKVDYVKTTLKVSSYTIGDANADGDINVSDFTAIANHILGYPSVNFVEKAADVNLDGDINVSDLTGVANLILYGTVTQSVVSRVVARNANAVEPYLSVSSCNVPKGQEVTLNVEVNGNYKFSAYQFDVKVPHGFSVKMSTDGEPCVSESVERMMNVHGTDVLLSRVMPDGTLRVVCASIDGTAFNVADGCIAEITLVADNNIYDGSYECGVNNIVLSDNADGINPTDISFELNVGSAITPVEKNFQQNGYNVYDLEGRKLNGITPESGIYIIGGRKYLK